ncbi:DUF2934 domain-containing protein [Sphingobium sp. DC-2]|uniref:DUF2934 domain-containing protein n=1 Tax=Sphingobium sp. DC-2 TaxID=1303256 RepID=UPI00055BEF51
MGQEKDDRHEAVKARAYRIWEEEGCPPGRDEDHWLRAEQAIAEETAPADSSAAGAVPEGGSAASPQKAAPRRKAGPASQ